MALSYTGLAQPDNAIKLHQAALQLTMKSNDRLSTANTHGNIAVAYQLSGDSKEAKVTMVRMVMVVVDVALVVVVEVILVVVMVTSRTS